MEGRWEGYGGNLWKLEMTHLGFRRRGTPPSTRNFYRILPLDILFEVEEKNSRIRRITGVRLLNS